MIVARWHLGLPYDRCVVTPGKPSQSLLDFNCNEILICYGTSPEVILLVTWFHQEGLMAVMWVHLDNSPDRYAERRPDHHLVSPGATS